MHEKVKDYQAAIADYEIASRLGGLTDGESSAMEMKEHLPANLAHNVQDIDVCLTWNDPGYNWQKRDVIIEEEQTICYKFKTNMNKRLEKASQAGATVHTIDVNYWTEDPLGGGNHEDINFWVTSEDSNLGSRFVHIDGGLGTSTYFNGWIGIGWATNKRNGYKCYVRPVLAF